MGVIILAILTIWTHEVSPPGTEKPPSAVTRSFKIAQILGWPLGKVGVGIPARTTAAQSENPPSSAAHLHRAPELGHIFLKLPPAASTIPLDVFSAALLRVSTACRPKSGSPLPSYIVLGQLGFSILHHKSPKNKLCKDKLPSGGGGADRSAPGSRGGCEHWPGTVYLQPDFRPAPPPPTTQQCCPWKQRRAYL